MTELILWVWVIALTLYSLGTNLSHRRMQRKYNKLFQILVEGVDAQRKINESQFDINTVLGQNLEMLGVHTKLIPPSVSMQAEAFLAWHNKRKEREQDG